MLALAILASLISFSKFSHCVGRDWASPDNYIHACYTDIAPLYAEKNLANHQWSYSNGDKAVEYPPVIGTVMYLTSFPFEGMHGYYYLNVLLLLLLFIATIFILQRMSQYGFWYALAPAVLASTLINWDLWAIPTMLLAIYWFDRKKLDLSALALGISIATKFFPVLLLIPIVAISVRNHKFPSRYIFLTIFSWLVINLPVALTTPTGWWYFFKLNLERGADWGSIWNIAQTFGWTQSNINSYASIAALTVLVLSTALFFNLKSTPKLAEVSFIIFAATLIVSKVYSPQYVLWLSALALIAIDSKQTKIVFWVWQVAEIFYHVAIWEYLATLSNAKFGLNETGYALISLIRIGALAGMVASLVHQVRFTQRKPWDFLYSAPSRYP